MLKHNLHGWEGCHGTSPNQKGRPQPITRNSDAGPTRRMAGVRVECVVGSARRLSRIANRIITRTSKADTGQTTVIEIIGYGVKSVPSLIRRAVSAAINPPSCQ